MARPGDPGGDTWGDLPLRFRAGGDAWIAGSYDPDVGLVYWGTAQAKPWSSAVRGTAGRGRRRALGAAAVGLALATVWVQVGVATVYQRLRAPNPAPTLPSSTGR